MVWLPRHPSTQTSKLCYLVLVVHRGVLWDLSHPGSPRPGTVFHQEEGADGRRQLCKAHTLIPCIPDLTHRYTQGASAVLVYGALESPFAQPRAYYGGHFFGALAGVIITKLFQLLPTQERYDQLAWLAASLSCATAVVVMQVTQTVHPPAGEW